MKHTLQSWKCGIVIVHHNNVANEWGVLRRSAIIPKAVRNELLINYVGQPEAGGGGGERPHDTRIGQECINEGEDLPEGAGGITALGDSNTNTGTAVDIDKYVQEERGIHKL